jgi:hypothetical protein
MSVQYDLSLVVAMMVLPYHTKAFEGAVVDTQVIGGHHRLADSGDQAARTAAGSKLERRW